jgi:RNA polymerase sigma-32 factor
MKAEVIYARDVGHSKPLSSEEERELARRYKEGDIAAGQRLVAANVRFAVKVAGEYLASGMAMQDLVQEANVGMMRALGHFDPDKGIRFISYAIWWIRAQLRNATLSNWSIVKMGTTQAQRAVFYGVAIARRRIEREKGRPATQEELAAHLRVKVDVLEDMQRRMQKRDVFLENKISDNDDASTFTDLLESTAPSQEQALGDHQEARVTRRLVLEALKRLDPRERHIIRSRMMADEPITLVELGHKYGCSRERIRQIELRAVKKLRRVLAALREGAERRNACW